MTTAPPISEFMPTGVWLEHFVGTEEVPIDLFRGFREKGGTGVILDSAGWLTMEHSTKALRMSKELGLQSIVMVSYQVLLNASISKVGLEPLDWAIEPADAVLVTFRSGSIIDSETETVQQATEQAVEISEAPLDLTGHLSEKPWLLLVPPQSRLPQDLRSAYPGPLTGFVFDRIGEIIGSDSPPFPSAQEARNSVDERGWFALVGVRRVDGHRRAQHFSRTHIGP